MSPKLACFPETKDYTQIKQPRKKGKYGIWDKKSVESPEKELFPRFILMDVTGQEKKERHVEGVDIN